MAAEVLLKSTKPDLSAEQLRLLVWWGVFFSFAPDLDNFAAFAKIHAWWYKPGMDNTIHRKFLTHVPLLWLAAGLLIALAAPNTYVRYFGLMVWLGSWTHFALDSIDYGVMWLWPFNKKVWALRNRGIRPSVNGKNFFDYWWNFIKLYVKSWTFYAEVLILLITLIISTKY
ncbi:MAG: metal-dependent hydrolase [Patescibacteria group bacterium]|nr:metal-dependent hydrolase [Patescibacteria group bacterium]